MAIANRHEQDEPNFAPRPESAPAVDLSLEQENIREQERIQSEQAPKPAEAKTASSKVPKFLRRATPMLPAGKDPIAIKIEKIMEDGLGDAYNRLSPIAKQEFKIKGEITAEKIRDLLRATHVKAKKVLRLILEWLKLLPGINKFFLEQEAKIKADLIVALKNKQ
ncbi:MAG: hypothetical protein A3J93_03990 [Candidatus Magasanikbacteria bacterium RIFOXYC2_FULL_42_28]|uniref:Uncharacterized protein n=1 Tax=Candidatus Magasanikbacteria bacterium RIFOXYC2_FULL_42_28 TaxID=1798704 RepID=A0A1F6NUN7_9BACT|nr:MAG: hypothetical protein A3J93_03990 [Candidatus Magasanikbacteria bacterium RIFOXYC2_FULL_42_28]